MENYIVCRITGKKRMTVGWKVGVEKIFNAKVHYLNDWVYEIRNLEDARIISFEIQEAGLSTSPIFEEMDGTYSINWS